MTKKKDLNKLSAASAVLTTLQFLHWKVRPDTTFTK